MRKQRQRICRLLVVVAACFAAAPVPTASATNVTTVTVPHVVTTQPTDDPLSKAVSYSTIAVALAAVFGLAGIVYQNNAAKRNAIDDRTADLQAQWISKEFMQEEASVSGFLRVKCIDDCMDKVRAWSEAPHVDKQCLASSGSPATSRLAVLHVLRFFEDLCQRYNRNELNCELLATSFGPDLLGWFVAASWWIHWRRAAMRLDYMYGEWEKTLHDLRRNHRRHRHPVYAYLRNEKVEFRIRAICVPPKANAAGSDEWELATRLARALASAPMSEGRPVPEDGPTRSKENRGWTVALVPESLDQEPNEHSRDKAIAIALEARLDELNATAISEAVDKLEKGKPVVETFGLFASV